MCLVSVDDLVSRSDSSLLLAPFADGSYFRGGLVAPEGYNKVVGANSSVQVVSSSISVDQNAFAVSDLVVFPNACG